jgi:hypothetical protein
MRKLGFKKPHIKKTPISKAFEEPRGPKGPEPMRMKPPSIPKPAPFGRVKRSRGTFGSPF